MTPHFLKHFDIRGIVDKEALKFKIKFAALQLGIQLELDYQFIYDPDDLL